MPLGTPPDRLDAILRAANSYKQHDSKLPYGTSLYWLKFAMHRLAGTWQASSKTQERISNAGNFGQLYTIAKNELHMTDQEIAVFYLHTLVDMHEGPRTDWMRLLEVPYTAVSSRP